MTTTVLATALPYSLADDAPFHLTVFLTHKLVGAGATLSDYPAAASWPQTLAGCTFALVTSSDPTASHPLRVVPNADAASWAAVLPPATPVAAFPTPVVSDQPWHTNPASRMSDHAIDLHLAAIASSPLSRPGIVGDPVALGVLQTVANLDQRGPAGRLLGAASERERRPLTIAAQRLKDALTTIGPLIVDDHRDGRELPSPPEYQTAGTGAPSAIESLLDDPDSDLRVTKQLDALVGQDIPSDPQLKMLVDAHAMRRYYERPEQPQQEPRAEPDPLAPPTPRPDRPDHDFHARVASFGSVPALLRRLGLAVDVVLDGLDAAGARAALAEATWVSVTMTSPDADVEVLPARRTSVVVDGAVFAARSSDEWVGGALPLGEDAWVVLDADPDASGLKLDQHLRNLVRQLAAEANGDPATSAPATIRSTGFAIARRDRAAQLRGRVQQAEALASDDGSRVLLLDDVVRGIRVEVWDDASKAWHSLHHRRVTVTGEPGGVQVLADAPDAGFLQLSSLNRAPDDTTNGYYVHEVVAGWDGWSLSAPRPGRTIVHVEPPGPDGATEVVVDAPPDTPIDGAHVVSRVEPGSLPRLRYGTSYSFRVLAVDLAGNSVPPVAPGAQPPAGAENVGAAQQQLEVLRKSYETRDAAGVAVAHRDAILQELTLAPAPEATPLPTELLSGNSAIDSTLTALVAGAVAARPAAQAAQAAQAAIAAQAATRVFAETNSTLRVRPQLLVDPQLLAHLAWGGDLQLPNAARQPDRPIVTLPRPYLRWEPVPAPAIVARHELGTGEQIAHLVVRTGVPDAAGPDARPDSERHLAPPKASQLEAETAGLFDAAIGTGDADAVRRLYAVALAERGTLLDQFAPSLDDASGAQEQPGIALVDRPGADTGSAHRSTLAQITGERGRGIGEGQYVIHDTDSLRLPYLPDPFATGVSLVFYEAGSPHTLPEPRALQAVAVPYPGQWPALQPLRLVVEPGDSLGAEVDGNVVRVQLPPGEQVRVALSSTLDAAHLDRFGLWRSHPASAVPSGGFSQDQLVALATLQRAAASGWTWWLTPSTDLRLVHAVPAPVRPPTLSALSVFLRPEGRSVAALTGLVDVHGPSTDTLVVRATWTEWVDDPAQAAPHQSTRSDVVARSTVGERERTGVLFLYDFQPTGTLARALAGVGFHKLLQTFPDPHHRTVSYVPGGTSRYAEYFPASQRPAAPTEGDAVTLDIPASARPAAPVVVDTVPLLRWEEGPEPSDPFAWRQVRRAGVRVWLARPWFSSGDGELLGVLVFDPTSWVEAADGTWSQAPKAVQVPDGATSLWGADPILRHGGATTQPTVPPLLAVDQLLLDLVETGAADAGAAQGVDLRPPLGGRVLGGRDRGWPHAPGRPVAVADAVPLRDVVDEPAVRVLGYQPEFDEASGRWFVDIAINETPALWPFLRLAVARYQPSSIERCALSPVAVTSWVQPLPARTLTVSRPDPAIVQVTLTGIVGWLRFDATSGPDLPGDQLSADAPTGDAATRAARLQQSRTVRASVQYREDGAGDLEWRTAASSLLLAVSVDEASGYQATWTGSIPLADAGAVPVPGLRRPGADGSSWRVLVEEHELLDTDPYPTDPPTAQVPRVVYAGEVAL